MWTKRIRLILALLILGLLQPLGVSASPLTIVGSLTITGDSGAALTTELVGVAVVANPGFEKNITIQIPPFTLPVFVDGEVGAASISKPLKKNFDTTLILTNATDAALDLELTLRDADGAVLSTTDVSLDAGATEVIPVSDLLP